MSRREATDDGIIRKTNEDALITERTAAHTTTEQPWQTWVYEFVHAQLVMWGNGIRQGRSALP